MNSPFLLSIMSWMSICPVLYGLGLRVPDQDAEAIARGNAFVATADNPSAIYYNPSGITQLKGHHIRLGTYAIALNSEYTSFAGSSLDTKFSLQPLPQFYYTYSPAQKPFAVGLGFYSPYGLGIKWPDDTPFRTIATRGELRYLTLNPVVAWQILPVLSLAAGPTLNFGDTDLRQGVLPVNRGDQFKFTGDDTQAGFNVGLLWKPHEQHALGLTYRSATTLNFRGHSELTGPPPIPVGSQSASVRFKFPQQIVAGWSYRPTPAWNLEFDVDWTDWDALNTVTLQQAVGSRQLPYDWQSSFLFEWGVTHYFKKAFRASMGYIYSQNSVPEARFNPLVPDSDRHLLSAGLGQRFKHFEYMAAYQFGFSPTRTVNNSVYGPAASGQYDFTSHAITLSAGFNF